MQPIYRIGYHNLIGEPFWVLVTEAIYQRAQQLNIELVPLVDPEQLSGDDRFRQIEEIAALELGALISATNSMHLIQPVVDAGIPVVLMIEGGLQHPLIASPKGLRDAAETAVTYLAERMRGAGRLMVVGGLVEGIDRGRSRLDGVRAALQRFPGVEVMHIPAPWGYTPGYEYVLDAVPSLSDPPEAIFGLSDPLALAAADALKAMGLLQEHALVAGINGDPLALAAIIQGGMTATVDIRSGELGRQIVDLAYGAAQGQSLPPHFQYRTRLVTSDNAAEIAAQKLVAISDLPSRLVNVNRHLELKRLTQLETSLAINRRLGSILDRRKLRHEIADLIRANYGYDDVQIFLWEGDRHELVLDQPEEDPRPPIRIPLSEAGLLGYTLARNRPTYVPDMQHSQRFPPDPYWPATRSRAIVPIRLGDEVLGLLDLHSRRLTGQTYEDLLGLQALADQLGVSMRNAYLYGEAVAARAEAERARQLKNRLLANVSHELRTPLNVIAGYSQAVLRRPDLYNSDLPPALLKDLRHIYTSSGHLERLISDLLDLSRAEIGELEIVPELHDPREVLVDAFESMAGSMAAPGAVEWRLHLPELLPQLHADPGRLRQILLNLLSNAGKFTVRGHITLGAEAQQEYLHIWVEDTGRGIAPELQARIFETFSTLEQPTRPGQGIGLGLRVTHELVKLHRGALHLQSTPNMGSVFHVLLPWPGADELAGLAAQATDRASAALFLDRPEALPPQISELTRRAVHYIWEHYVQAFTREEMAGSLGVTAGYLTRLFHRELGITPWEYLTRVRVEQAKALLATSKLSITEIAGRVGYNDAAYFSRVFRRETGRSARAFRKQTGD